MHLPGALGAPIGAAQSLLALSAMLWLLLTTPADAIRLRWPTSAAIIALGAAGLPLLAQGAGGVIGAAVAGFGALLVLGLLLTPGAPMSPWWGVLILWRPGLWALWTPITGSQSLLHGAGARLGVLLAIMLVFGVFNGWPKRIVWALWGVGAGLEIVAAAA